MQNYMQNGKVPYQNSINNQTSQTYMPPLQAPYNPQPQAAPACSAVNIQIFNPAVNPANGSVYPVQTGSAYDAGTNGGCYPSSYYTTQPGGYMYANPNFQPTNQSAYGQYPSGYSSGMNAYPPYYQQGNTVHNPQQGFYDATGRYYPYVQDQYGRLGYLDNNGQFHPVDASSQNPQSGVNSGSGSVQGDNSGSNTSVNSGDTAVKDGNSDNSNAVDKNNSSQNADDKSSSASDTPNGSAVNSSDNKADDKDIKNSEDLADDTNSQNKANEGEKTNNDSSKTESGEANASGKNEDLNNTDDNVSDNNGKSDAEASRDAEASKEANADKSGSENSAKDADKNSSDSTNSKETEKTTEKISEKSSEQSSEADDGQKTKKIKVVALSNDYIKTLENYLDSQDVGVRKMGAHEVVDRLTEDSSRKDDPALTALVNKMLQDPSTAIRAIALSIVESRMLEGDDLTVKILKKMQKTNDGYGLDATLARSALLKMAGKTVEKEIPLTEDEIKNNKKSKETK